jgi:hypothetical protein
MLEFHRVARPVLPVVVVYVPMCEAHSPLVAGHVVMML